MYDFDAINDRFPVSEVLARYGIEVRHGAFCCPFHEDNWGRPNGSVYTANGRERWKCHKCDIGGDSIDFVQRLKGCNRIEAIAELTGEAPQQPRPRPKPQKKPDLKLVRDLVPFPKAHGFQPGVATPKTIVKGGATKSWTPQLVHPYRNQRGETLMIAIRVVKGTLRKDGKPDKVVLPVRYDRDHGPVSMGWQDGEDRLLYNEPLLKLRPEDPVLVVEGEKCADALKALPQFSDYIVVSWQGGSSSVRLQAWGKLKGRKIVIWPDNDDNGLKAMRTIAKAVQPAEVRVVEPLADWPDKHDAWDLLQTMPADEVRQLMENLAGPYDAGPPPDEPPPDREGEPIRYLLTEEGGIARTEVTNWSLFVERDPRFGHELSYDVFDKEILVDGRPLDDLGVDRLAHKMGLIMGFRSLNVTRIAEIFLRVAKLKPVNRLADELRATAWDGTERHLTDYAGAVKSDWTAVAGWRWLLGLVKRILEPGCKHDLVLVLEGRQGMKKSMFFETLGQICGRNLYTDLAKLSQDKDIQMKLAGKAVVELSEMTAHRLTETDALKGMLTATADHYRPPYGRHIDEVPRTCVFGGSTNEERYLKDMTGNRRYLIVEVTQPADIAALKRDLPQLLAEAVVAIDKGEQNWLTPEEEKLQVRVVKTREVEWPQFDEIESVLGSTIETWSSDSIRHALGIPRERWNNQLKAGLTKTLTDLGWKYSAKTRRWQRPKLDPDTP